MCCVNEGCEHLDMNGIATCSIYDSPDRPAKCRLFPEMPPIPKEFKDCGYYFVDTWNDDVESKHEVL